MVKAILYLGNRCIGCRSCQVACKRWNELEAEKTELSQTWTNPPSLSAYTWNVILMNPLTDEKGFNIHFATLRCMHCKEPVCAAVCPVRAIYKDADTGAIVINSERCVGCLACVELCPFRIPKFAPGVGSAKCRFCIDRLKLGLKPACVQACPTEALTIDDREKIVELAKRWAGETKGYIYGLEEAGGTNVIMVLTAPPEKLGLPRVEKKSYLSSQAVQEAASLAATVSTMQQATETLKNISPGLLLAAGIGGIIALRMNRSKGQAEAVKAA
ncbi:MAG: 4Fe-4S dicluster domain-containing protein [Candidatus Nezhaarchaeales archaeon]